MCISICTYTPLA